MKQDEFIKDNLYQFLDGEYNSKFSSDQLKYMIKYSFYLNYTKKTPNITIFEWDKYRLALYSTDHAMISEFNMISSENIFRMALSSFIRDYRISKIF